MLLVSVSGAQSCGKSSVLDGISRLNLEGFHVDGFKTARFVLEKFDEPLVEIVNDAANLIEFQTLIFDAKYEHDKELRKTYYGQPVCIFTERSMIDVAAFAASWKSNSNMSGLKVYQDWVDSRYLRRCLEAQLDLYDAVSYLPIGVFDHVDDGVRAKRETQQFVDKTIVEYSIHTRDFQPVVARSIQDRVTEIVNRFTSSLNLSKLAS